MTEISLSETTEELSRRRVIVISSLVLLSVAVFAAFGTLFWQDSDMWRKVLTDFLEQARGTPWALPLVIAAYVLGGLIMFPVTLMNLIVAIVFGLWGILYGLIGVMANAGVYFALGALTRRTHYGQRLLKNPSIHAVDVKLKKAGLAGMVALHALPAPPYTIMNFIAGLSSVTAFVYLLSTFLAMLPGAIARGVVGESLTRILLNPTAESYWWLAGGIALWIVLIAASHILLQKFEAKEKTAA